MALKRFDFQEWVPDQPLSQSVARNVYPLPSGYRPAKQFQSITPALANFMGGTAYVASDGTSTLLGGTNNALYRYNGTAWVSIIGSLTAGPWQFTQFGDIAIGVFGDTPVKVDLTTGTGATLGGSPPDSDMVATVRDFVWLAGDPAERLTLRMSGFNNAEQWTPGVNQSTDQLFYSGGEIMGLAGGETGIVLQRSAIKRGTYVGGDLIWQFDEISDNIGCMAKGSVARAGQLVFFLSEQGFKVTDRNSVTSIGAEKVDRTFFSSYSRADIEGITAAVDPRTTIVAWAMPGNPGRIWLYNWSLQKWAFIDVDIGVVFSGFTADITLEALNALYPGGLDTMPVSLDDPMFAGGNPLFLLSNTAGAVGTLSGDNLSVMLSIRPIEVETGRQVRIRGARAVSDAPNGTVTVDVRPTAGSPQVTKVSGAIRPSGRVPLRGTGRHIGMQLEIPIGLLWSYAVGLDLEYEGGGER